MAGKPKTYYLDESLVELINQMAEDKGVAASRIVEDILTEKLSNVKITPRDELDFSVATHHLQETIINPDDENSVFKLEPTELELFRV